MNIFLRDIREVDEERKHEARDKDKELGSGCVRRLEKEKQRGKAVRRERERCNPSYRR